MADAGEFIEAPSASSTSLPSTAKPAEPAALPSVGTPYGDGAQPVALPDALAPATATSPTTVKQAAPAEPQVLPPSDSGSFGGDGQESLPTPRAGGKGGALQR